MRPVPAQKSERNRDKLHFTTDAVQQGEKVNVAKKLEPGSMAPDTQARPRVIVIDDERDFAEELVAAFERKGFDARCAFDVDAGVQLAADFVPDVIVTDLVMPGGSGRRIVEACEVRDPPGPIVLCMTAHSEITMEEMFAAGAHGFFQKPLRASDLISAADRLLRMREAMGEALELVERKERENAALAGSDLLGSMLPVIIHEISNPLSALKFRFAQLHRKLEQADEMVSASVMRSALSQMERTLERIERLVVAVRRTSHRAAAGASVGLVNLVDLMSDVSELASPRAHQDQIAFSAECVGEVPLIRGDHGELVQILLNLASNAFDAVAEKPAPEVKITACLRSPQEIEIAVEDSGPGIPPELQAKVLEPFFTTKPVGKGTGLGLPLCVHLAHRNGGELRYDTASPRTRFLLLLHVKGPS